SEPSRRTIVPSPRRASICVFKVAAMASGGWLFGLAAGVLSVKLSAVVNTCRLPSPLKPPCQPAPEVMNGVRARVHDHERTGLLESNFSHPCWPGRIVLVIGGCRREDRI